MASHDGNNLGNFRGGMDLYYVPHVAFTFMETQPGFQCRRFERAKYGDLDLEVCCRRNSRFDNREQDDVRG